MTGESSARATQLLAFRSAALTLWGTSAWQKIVDALPTDTREDLVGGGLVVAVGWIPERHMVSLAQAVLDGPAEGNLDTYREFIRQVIALGFGRVRRMLVQFAQPAMVLKRAPELWRHDHTQGALSVEIQESSAVVYVDHEVLTSTPLSCTTCAEMFRAVLALTRARNVTATHRLDRPGRLRVDLQWQ